ncbi:MAG: ATP-binding protein [Rhodoferax sp.]|uniref:ATP-binding protein n=1 Tax=Rhodoferax sp. TaxID=50421 RepID=UPI00262C9F7E|nr:ATP-binding protein [Rhodoferax sp.]MDD2881769.1 ATP-binding protein [Rhodoferax sp.]
MAPEPLRICLMGAECTGKTTLARTLAQHFSGFWVPEYLRFFCDQQGRPPRADEQAMVMRTQFEQEAQVLALARQAGVGYVFCDTAPLMTAVYSDFYFADRSLYASANLLHGSYALTLVLTPDLAWVPDGLQRDGSQARAAVGTMLQHVLQTMRYPAIVVSGGGECRLQAAILAVETLTR